MISAALPRLAPPKPVRMAPPDTQPTNFARMLDGMDCKTLGQAQRSARRDGCIRTGLALGESAAGTGMLLAPLSGMHISAPLMAGMMLAGLSLDLHAVHTARNARRLLNFAQDAGHYSAAMHQPATAIGKVDAVRFAQAQDANDRAHATAVVKAHGCNSLARMALFDDKSYLFSAGGSVVSYAVTGHTAVALSDPIGPPQDFAAALDTFVQHCKRHHWKPVFYQVSANHVDDYRHAGFKTLRVGHEAIVDVQAFTMTGARRRNLRTIMNRFNKAGYRAQVHEGPLPDDLVAQLRQVSDSWLGMMHGKEKRFSLGAFDDAYVREGPVLVVYTPQGQVSAFANVVPEYQKNEVAIDLMRRTPDAATNTMDYLFTNLFQWAKQKGYQSVSLGLSPLSGVGDRKGDPAAERAVHFAYEHLNQFYNFKGLHAFKEKWDPAWTPRYVAYQGAAGLAPAALALVSLSSGKGFLRDYAGDLLHHLRKSK